MNDYSILNYRSCSVDMNGLNIFGRVVFCLGWIWRLWMSFGLVLGFGSRRCTSRNRLIFGGSVLEFVLSSLCFLLFLVGFGWLLRGCQVSSSLSLKVKGIFYQYYATYWPYNALFSTIFLVIHANLTYFFLIDYF